VRGRECAHDEPLGLALEPDVVEREVERPLGRVEEGCGLARDDGRVLPAVRECPELDQLPAAARIAALCARFAAW
jgi:hypothetical protein